MVDRHVKVWVSRSLLLCTLLAAGPALAQSMSERANGGSMKTDLGYGIVINKASAMTREWIAIRNPNLPVNFVGTPGVITTYRSERNSSNYYYELNTKISVTEPIAAIEILVVCFDIWGKPTKTLSTTEVQDFGVGEHAYSAQWKIFRETEVSEHYASIAYVSRVRTASGRVIEADRTKVIEEGKRLYTKFSDQNALPAEEKKPE